VVVKTIDRKSPIVLFIFDNLKNHTFGFLGFPLSTRSRGKSYGRKQQEIIIACVLTSLPGKFPT
jgi:hypothetical protein